jgi:DNA-binding LacI/PurR family transcriptional regulator
VSTQPDDRPVTIYTVADRAGVSIATVSRVLRGTAPTSPTTRRKVLQAVQELEYIPLRAARKVEVPRHQTHGLVLPGLNGPYYSELLSGFEAAAARYGQSVVIQLAGASVDLEDAVRRLLRRVDGLVLANDTVSDAFVRHTCRGTPTVLVARNPVHGCDTVLVENVSAAQELTDHLLRHGRRRLVFVGDPADSHDVTERYAGFRSALARSTAVEARPPVLVPLVEGSGAEAVAAVLDLAQPADALVCANDELAVAMMSVLARQGVTVPDELAVVGFDDLMTARYVHPGLTTVLQPMRSLGHWAAIRLHERIEGRTHDVHPQVLPTRLVVRGSCGCQWDGPTAA